MVKKKSKSANQRSTSIPTELAPRPPTTKKCVPINLEREDPAPAAQARFAPLSLEIHKPDTAILLLSSAERPVLLAAAEALASYGAKAQGNLEHLFDLRVVEAVLALVRHEDVFTRRFALKLLALMSAVTNVQDHLLEDDTHILCFTEMLNAEEDVFVQEFASRILAEMTGQPKGAAMLLDNYLDASLFVGKLSSDDPDIKKNCIEILGNLLKDFRGLDAVFRTKTFSFEAVYELFKEPYPVIQQLALDVVGLLVAHSASEDVQESFRSSGGPQCLLDIFGNDEWKDLFDKVVGILNLACYNASTAELLHSTGATKRLFAFMENTEDDKLRFRVLSILVCLADNLAGRKVLHELGLVSFLISLTETEPTPAVQARVCQGFAKMTQHVPAAAEIADGNPVDYILHLLANDQAEWSERQAAAFALKVLVSSDFQNCVNFLDCAGLIHLTRMIQHPGMGVPWEIQATITQALSAMLDYPVLTGDLIEPDLLSALCSHLDPELEVAEELRVASCQALCRFAVSEEARRSFISARLHRKIHCLLLKSASMPVLQSLAHLLLCLCHDDYFARLCAQEGCLFHMLKNHSMSRVIESWDTCIEALFRADLPMKFAYTGRLCLRDLTADGFHALRHSFCPFPVLDDLFRLKLCPLQPIYVANFAGTSQYEDDDDFPSLTSKCAAFNAARESMRRQSFEQGIRVSEATINAWLELKFGRLQPDPDLVAYLELFRAELAAAEKSRLGALEISRVSGLVQTSRIESRARLLGKFVARQLSGSDPSKPPTCLDQQLEVHLLAIKERLETNVIPLGLLRLGSYLERALLFKVMADRIALPACLVRGCYGKSWVEVAVPVSDASGPSCALVEDAGVRYCELGPADEFPGLYLRENFIVDLMDEPGELIAIGSCKAERYHESRAVCKFACCEANKRRG